MTNKLHEFVPPFTLYLNIQNAQNPARKHFEKTNITEMAGIAVSTVCAIVLPYIFVAIKAIMLKLN